MKKLLFAIFTFLFVQFKAQDTLFLKNSSKLTVQLLEINPDNIKYKRFDNLTGPLYTHLKSEVLFIVFANGKKEVFESVNLVKTDTNAIKPTDVNLGTDTIVFNSGRQMPVKIAEINSLQVKYKMINNPDGPTYSTLKSEVNHVTFSSGLVQQFGIAPAPAYDASKAGNNKGPSLYEKGKSDALRHYNHNGGSIAIGCSAAGCAPLALIPAVIVGYTEPTRNHLRIPVSAYSSNNDYVTGYTYMASRIKTKKVWTAFGVGTLVFIGWVAYIIMSR
jgi:hypothetical protein